MSSKILEGCHTMVYLTNGTVDKVYGLKSTPFTLRSALIEATDLVLYDRALRKIGVRTPERYGFQLRHNPKGPGLLLVETVQYIPDSVDDLFPDASPEMVLTVAKDMFSIISATLPTRGRTIIDTPISNFRRDREITYYVDLMPPRGRIRGIYRIERPEPRDKKIKAFLFQRYCGPSTPVLALNQWCRRRPQLRRQFEELIRKTLETRGNLEAAEFFEQRPAKNLSPVTINRLTPYDCDHIRDIGCELAYRGNLTVEGLRDIFSLAHIVPGGILPAPEEITRAKQLLLAYC